MSKVKRALISVSDKSGIVDFARGLSALGVEIVSTGGTARLLKESGIEVREISDLTGFPEMMGGRVKTLHPKVHGAILADRDNPGHMEEVERNGIELIDLVVVNLYPFEETISKEGVSIGEAVENIDIGGPTLLRSAAKNYRHVAVVTDPADYGRVLSEIESTGEVSERTRAELCVKAFRKTADYDASIDRFMSERLCDEKVLRLKYVRGRTLRYGENWHQGASFYSEELPSESSLALAEQLHGKELSYNNYVDGNSALEAVKEISNWPAVAVIKHTNPCGYATGVTLRRALEAAWAGDPVSAFGSVLAFSREVDLETAEFLRKKFVDVMIAPGYTDDALEFLRKKSKNMIILRVPPFGERRPGKVYRHVVGGMLEQDRNLGLFEKWETVTKKEFPAEKVPLAEFAWRAVKHVKSNAIVLCREYEGGWFQLLGMGAGQPNRVDSLRKLAATKARENIEALYEAESPAVPFEDYVREVMGEAVLASDGFFPFSDTVAYAAELGIRYIVQPGGSVRDGEVIEEADKRGISMVFTGMRHFLH